MSAFHTILTTGEILAIFAFCLSTSLGIAYAFLKAVVILTTRANHGGFTASGSLSRRSLGAGWLRSHRELGTRNGK